VIITGANAHLLLLALAGDKKFCDNKRIVTISDVILSGFDCITELELTVLYDSDVQ